MKILQSAIRGCAVLGFGPQQSTAQKYPINRKNVQALFILCMALIYSCIYFFLEANTFEDYTLSVYVSATIIFIISVYIMFVWRNRAICDVLDSFESTVNERLMYPISAVNYVKIDFKSEKWTKIIHFVYLKIVLLVVMIPKLIFSFYFYYATDLGIGAFELPFPVWFPFDWKNPIGYLVAFIQEYIVMAYFCIFTAAAISLEVGCYFWMMVFIEDIKNDISSFNRTAKSKKNHSQMFKTLPDSIEFHGHVKRIVYDLSKSIQPMLTAMFSWSICTICGSMLIMQILISSESVNLVKIIIPMDELTGSFVVAFVTCEVFGRITDEFHAIGDVMNRFKWYLFPVKMQKMLPMILIHAQQPVDINCFGMIPCNRETFKKVTNSGFSYFMLLRQLGI